MQINYLKIEITPCSYRENGKRFNIEVVADNRVFTVTRDLPCHDFESVFDLMINSAKEEILRMIEKEDLKK